MEQKEKPLGWDVPCRKDKTHRVGMTTGICRNCDKYIQKPTISQTEMNETLSSINKVVFGD